jgi:hypothetical protein
MLDEAGQQSVARMKAPCSRFGQANHMNLSEIAKRAKVSTATVSRTINRTPTVVTNFFNDLPDPFRKLTVHSGQ